MSEKKIKYSPDHTFFTSDTHLRLLKFLKILEF